MMEFDLNALSLEELEALEEETGLNVLEMPATFKPKMKHVTGFVWLMLRREDPELTIAEVRKRPLAEVVAMLPPDVAGAGASGPGSRPSRTSTASRRKRSGI